MKTREKKESSEEPSVNLDISNQGSIPETPSSPPETSSFEFEYAMALASATPTGEKIPRKVEKITLRSVSTSSKVSVEMAPAVLVERSRERTVTDVSESGNETDVDVV